MTTRPTNPPRTSPFKPYEHRNQHYVPVFWQRRFAGSNGVLFKKEGGKVTRANPDKLMSGDWIYTTFDAGGMPSNALEHGSSKIEAEAAQAMRSLDLPNAVGTMESQAFLRWFFAFSVCRHPDTMSMGHRRVKDLARLIAKAHCSTVQAFVSEMVPLGIPPADGAVMHAALCLIPATELRAQTEDLVNMAPTDSQLPQQIAIAPDTVAHVLLKLSHHDIEILEAPVGSDFVLGDTPFPPALGPAFFLPISAKLALLWTLGAAGKLPDWTRRVATQADVANSNRIQMENCLKTVVGPSVASLK